MRLARNVSFLVLVAALLSPGRLQSAVDDPQCSWDTCQLSPPGNYGACVAENIYSPNCWPDAEDYCDEVCVNGGFFLGGPYQCFSRPGESYCACGCIW